MHVLQPYPSAIRGAGLWSRTPPIPALLAAVLASVCLAWGAAGTADPAQPGTQGTAPRGGVEAAPEGAAPVEDPFQTPREEAPPPESPAEEAAPTAPRQAREAPLSTALPETTEEVPPLDEVRDLIDTLEDEQSRTRLIAQLRLMIEAKEATAGPEEPTAGDATAEALRQISTEMVEISNDLLVAAAGLEDLPQIRRWLVHQARDPYQRGLWLQVLGNLALTIGTGYAALWLVRLLLSRPRRRIAERVPGRRWIRLPVLGIAALLDLVPIGAFAIVAFLTLGTLSPLETTRLVALAWIHAVILAQIAQVLARMVFAARSAQLRLVPLNDAAARRGEGWVRRFALVGIYGWFGLEAALFLGLPPSGFEALLRLLGLIVLILLVVLVIRMRAPVARWIRGRGGGAMRDLRGRLASVWHIPALLYLVFLYGNWALGVTGAAETMLRGTLLSLAAIAAAAAAIRLVERTLTAALTPTSDPRPLRRQLRRRLRRYLPALRIAFRWLIQIATLLAILQAWGISSFDWLAEEPGRIIALTVLSLGLILLAALAVWEGASLGIAAYLAEQDDRVGQPPLRSARTRTLLSVARTALMVVLSVVTVLVVLSELGINIAPLLAAAGVLGLAVGFGSQKLVQDIITGFFILLEDIFSVGDVVKVGDRAGLVEAVSIRNVRLRDLSGTVHTIPFSTIDTVSNLTKEFSYHVFDLGVAYREDVDQVMDVLRELGAEMRADEHFGALIIDDLEIFGVDAFADSAVVVKGRIKTLPIKQWEVGREFNRRVKVRFDALDIEIPFPHRTLYFGVGKDGTAPPARVRGEPAAAAASAGETET